MSQLRNKVDMKKSFYQGNPKLKRTDVQLKLTAHQKRELKRCKANIQYFIENYLKVVHVDHGLVPLELYPYQKKLVDHINDNRYSIILSCRQSGKTTCTVAYLLHYSLFNKHKVIGVLANKAGMAQEILDRYKLAYECLPFWLQQGVVTWNAKDIEIENGSKIITGATGGSAARGFSFSCLFLDEAAFVPHNVWKPFFTSIWPTVSSGKSSKVIMVSTPNGMNHYYEMWMKANHVDPKKRSEFAPFEVMWTDVPGRDQAWKEAQINNTDESTFKQEFECLSEETNISISKEGLEMETTIGELYDKFKSAFDVK